MVMDEDKLNLIWWFDFRLEPIFATSRATYKILLASKVVKTENTVYTRV